MSYHVPDPRSHFDGLEVAPQAPVSTLEVRPPGTEKETLPSGQQPSSPFASYGGANSAPNSAQTRQTGLRRILASRDCRIAGVVLLLGCIISIGVGAGLGVGLQQRNQSTTPASTTGPAASSSPTASASRTASATISAVTSGTTGVAAIDCDAENNTYTGSDGTLFETFCTFDWPASPQGRTLSGSGSVTDLTFRREYTWEACMDSCVDYNGGLGSGGGTACQAVTYFANLSETIGVNCWLKNTQGINSYVGDLVASAVILRNGTS